MRLGPLEVKSSWLFRRSCGYPKTAKADQFTPANRAYSQVSSLGDYKWREQHLSLHRHKRNIGLW